MNGEKQGSLPERLKALLNGLATTAREAPERPALISPHGDRTFGELGARVNRLARVLRAAGLSPGDVIALLCVNRAEFAEVLFAAEYAGFRVTPINWHFSASEVAHIVNDSGARALFADSRFSDVAVAVARSSPKLTHHLAIGGEIDGFLSYEAELAKHADGPLEDPRPGGLMLYTSGTTGKPKGVRRDNASLEGLRELPLILSHLRFDATRDRMLCTGPLYHGANLGIALKLPIACGVPVVLMDGWNAAEALSLIARHRVTHSHMVPTMFQHLLALDQQMRSGADVSSLRIILHGGAPCPVPVKIAMMDWLGPVLYEYYGSVEGFGSFITPQEYLRKRGSVGRVEPQHVQVLDDEGRPVPAGTVGNVCLVTNQHSRFVYHNDEGKTRQAYRGDYFTVGDLGYVDEDGYLFLVDRSADVIISGGVNIYPAEVDAVLVEHPAVQDAVAFGIPSAEWGESVHALVSLRPTHQPTAELEAELIAFCRSRIAHFKCPRRIDFVDQVMRTEMGKSCRRLLREQYREKAALT